MTDELELGGLAMAARGLLEDLARRRPPPDEVARAIRQASAEAADLPPELVAALAREIESAVRPLMVSVCGAGTEALARGRFGFRARIAVTADPRSALAACRVGGRAVIALSGQDPWWARLLAEPKLSIIDDFLGPHGSRPAGFAVAPEWSQPSGADRTWWITDAGGSPAEIEAALGALGLSGRQVQTTGGMRLFALDGYVQAHDARLTQAPGRLSGVIGAVPLIHP